MARQIFVSLRGIVNLLMLMSLLCGATEGAQSPYKGACDADQETLCGCFCPAGTTPDCSDYDPYKICACLGDDGNAPPPTPILDYTCEEQAAGTEDNCANFKKENPDVPAYICTGSSSEKYCIGFFGDFQEKAPDRSQCPAPVATTPQPSDDLFSILSKIANSITGIIVYVVTTVKGIITFVVQTVSSLLTDVMDILDKLTENLAL